MSSPEHASGGPLGLHQRRFSGRFRRKIRPNDPDRARTDYSPGVKNEYLTSAEAAVALGVAPTSIKRWADARLLACHTTAGGHRRFLRSEVERFRRERLRGARAEPLSATGWIALFASKISVPQLQELLQGERDRVGSWWQLADRLGLLLAEIGSAWERGELSIAGEHELSERIERALASTLSSQPIPTGAPVCLLAAAPAEQHTLGLLLAELCLREAGWATRWIGAQTPIEELIAPIASGEIAMVALSASGASSSADDLARAAETVAAACREHSIALVLGGCGTWPETAPTGGPGSGRVRSFAELHQLLATRGRELDPSSTNPDGVLAVPPVR
jgi:excisionase family DNA binding protein